MRRRAERQNLERVTQERAAAPRDFEVHVRGGGFWAGLLILILLATSTAFAEPAAPAPGPIERAPAVVPAVGGEKMLARSPDSSLDPLLVIPGLSPFRSEAQVADDSIAAAVERGNNPDLERVSAFRKRGNDIFRAERPVEIGEQEMLLRLRLRAKARQAMSVELRF